MSAIYQDKGMKNIALPDAAGSIAESIQLLNESRAVRTVGLAV